MILISSILRWYRLIFLLFACKRCFSSSNTTSNPFFLMKHFLSTFFILRLSSDHPSSYFQVYLCAWVYLSSKIQPVFSTKAPCCYHASLNRFNFNHSAKKTEQALIRVLVPLKFSVLILLNTLFTLLTFSLITLLSIFLKPTNFLDKFSSMI